MEILPIGEMARKVNMLRRRLRRTPQALATKTLEPNLPLADIVISAHS